MYSGGHTSCQNFIGVRGDPLYFLTPKTSMRFLPFGVHSFDQLSTKYKCMTSDICIYILVLKVLKFIIFNSFQDVIMIQDNKLTIIIVNH